MFPHYAHGVGKARMEEAQALAEAARTRRSERTTTRRIRWTRAFSLRSRRLGLTSVALRSSSE